MLISVPFISPVSERSIGEQRVQMTVGGLIKAVVGMSCAWLVWENVSEPVITLPGALVWPLGPLLSFPSCQLGQVGEQRTSLEDISMHSM